MTDSVNQNTLTMSYLLSALDSHAIDYLLRPHQINPCEIALLITNIVICSTVYVHTLYTHFGV